MTSEQTVNICGAIPQEITVEYKTLLEQVKMIQELEQEGKTWCLNGGYLPNQKEG